MRGHLELPIRLVKPDDLSPRPKVVKGSKNILPRLWEKHRNEPFLPHDFLVPTPEELAKRARAEKREAREKRNARNREYRAANLEKERARKREAGRLARQDPAKKAKMLESNRRYNATPHGKAKRAEYEAKMKTPEQRAKRNAYMRDRYANDEAYRNRKRAYGRARYAAKPEERERQKPERNRRRKERYATDAEYRERQKQRARRDYQRKKEAQND